MSLFPFGADDMELDSTEVISSPIREYEIDFITGKLTGRIVEGVEALRVWAYLALKAQRYSWVIYSWYYGEEYTSLIGYSYSDEYLMMEIQRYIEECLFENEHITGVEDLEITHVKDTLHIKFRMITDVGSEEVELNV